jgi:aspartyl-tRNA(Asn)/glutamyl-tRNA(Gln) amidotransferase subunit C
MAIEGKEIEKVAHLARITVTAQEINTLTIDMSNILNLVAQISDVDTQACPSMAHPMECEQRLRPDVVTQLNQRDALQAVAPATEAGLYLVPQVIAAHPKDKS